MRQSAAKPEREGSETSPQFATGVKKWYSGSMNRKEQRGMLTGMVLGDAYVGASMGSKNPHITFNHSIKQRDYLEWKVRLLQPMFHYELIDAIRYREVSVKGKSYKVCGFVSRTNSRLKTTWHLAYPHVGKKRITRKLLDTLTPLGIAIWYMDDGCLNKGNRTLMFSTYCSKDEAEECVNYFQEKYGISFRLMRHKDKYCIATGWKSESANELKRLIESFIIPSMRYKIEDIAVATQLRKDTCKCGADTSDTLGGTCGKCHYAKYKDYYAEKGRKQYLKKRDDIVHPA